LPRPTFGQTTHGVSKDQVEAQFGRGQEVVAQMIGELGLALRPLLPRQKFQHSLHDVVGCRRGKT
jgi:hypothetical protein